MQENHRFEPSAVPALGQVRIFDELVSADLRSEILRLVRKPIWAYGWKSVKDRDRYSFWHAQFAGGDENSRDSCEGELGRSPALAPIFRLWQTLSSTILKGHEPLRVYANAHTFGVEGYVHTDSDDSQNYFTIIYYAHHYWEPNWAGETIFLEESGDVISAVYPKPGRIVFFRGATQHVARAPSRECPEIRISVVIKTRLGNSVP
jgi:SM-20-related protein